MGKLAVVSKEGRRSEQNRTISVVYQFRNDAVVKRAWIQEHFAARHQRHDRPAGEPKGVKQRQSNHEFVERREIRDRTYLRHIGEERSVCMHHTLRFSFGARRKKNDGGIEGSLGLERRSWIEIAPHHPEPIDPVESAL